MQRYVFAHTRLRQMVQHERGDTGTLPSRPDSHKRDVGIVVADVGYEKGATNDKALVQGDDAEFGIGQAFGHWKQGLSITFDVNNLN